MSNTMERTWQWPLLHFLCLGIKAVIADLVRRREHIEVCTLVSRSSYVGVTRDPPSITNGREYPVPTQIFCVLPTLEN